MPFHSVASIALQLVMQNCDAQTLLSFARCNRATLAAASCGFAWSHLQVTPFPVHFSQSESSQTTAARIGASLLRHCDIALTWGTGSGSGSGSGLGMRSAFADNIVTPDATLLALEFIPRLRVFDARTAPAGPKAFLRLLAHPSFSGLTALYVGEGHLDAECMRLLPLHQPRLRVLHVPKPRRSGAPCVGFLRPVAQLPQLEELRTSDLPGFGDEDDLAPAGQCASLRRLSVRSLRGYGSVPLLTAAGLRGLEELELEEVYARHEQGPDEVDVPIDWAACFANLCALRSLRLVECWGVDALLEELILGSRRSCPALRSLRVAARALSISESAELSLDVQEFGLPVPSARLVDHLLHARPLLHFTLDLPPLRDYLFVTAECGDAESADQCAGVWRRVQDEFDALAAKHPGRVAVTLTSLGLDMDE